MIPLVKYPSRVSPKISKKEPLIPYLGGTNNECKELGGTHEGIDLPFFTPISSSKSETPTREREKRERGHIIVSLFYRTHNNTGRRLRRREE